jgi:hypothetical protein
MKPVSNTPYTATFKTHRSNVWPMAQSAILTITREVAGEVFYKYLYMEDRSGVDRIEFHQPVDVFWQRVAPYYGDIK